MATVNSHPDFWRALIVGLTLVGLVLLGESVALRPAATARPVWLIAVAAVAASGLVAAVALAFAPYLA